MNIDRRNKNIERLIREDGWTRPEVAREYGLSVHTISDILAHVRMGCVTTKRRNMLNEIRRINKARGNKRFWAQVE